MALFSTHKLLLINTTQHTDQRFIQGLVSNNMLVVSEIYRLYAPRIKHYIIANSGTEDDAADIFQEALTDIYLQATRKQLELTCPFEPFLLLLCKRKWLNELKKRGRQPVTKEPDDVSIGEDVFAQAEMLQQQQSKMQLFLECFEKMGDACKEILTRYMNGEAQELIAAQLNVSYGYLRKKKSECMAGLTKMIYSQSSGRSKV